MNCFVRRARISPVTARSLSIVLALALTITLGNGVAMAQSQTIAQFATGLSTPQGGLVLAGTAVNPATGNPFRYLWTADAVSGLCRLDPDVDTPAAHAINPATCVNTVAGAAFNAGQLTFDAVSNTIYAVDGGGKLGIIVLHFLPDGDTGNGLVDTVNTSVLAPTCGIATNRPNATSLGPDGNLYIGFTKSGNIMRVNSPLTNPLPCANIQAIVIATGDKLTSQMAWVGRTMFLNTTRELVQVNLADSCLTPQNGNVSCVAGIGVLIVGATPTALVSDQASGQSSGDDLYFGGPLTNGIGAYLGITFNPLNPLGTPNMPVLTTIGGSASSSFANVGALALDVFDPTNNVVYIGDDFTGGLAPGTGRWWQALSTPPPPGPPSAPLNVIATAGNASASLTWNAPNNHQRVTSYTVHNSLASNGLPVADITLAAPGVGTTIVPTATNITGLVNGVTYQFEVLATNNQGSSPFSAPSNPVTPQPPTVPGAPTNVTATAGDTFATVSWVAPASDGGSPITGYTVSIFTGGVLVGTSQSGGTSVTVFPLTDGVAYTFSVHATNAIGNGPESAPSAPVTPAAPATPSVTVTMSGLDSVISNGSALYTVTVANTGTVTAPSVTLVDTTFGATVSSVTTSQGACTSSGTNINCNLGNVTAGNSVSISVTLKPANGALQMQNSATAITSGVTSSAQVTTTVIPLSQTTDVQVIGSAQNGGPAVTGTDSFTWQIRNNQTLAANVVHFTATMPLGMVFQSFSNTLGTCTSPGAGTAGATVTCDLATLNGGQAMIVTVNVTFNATGSMSTTGQAKFDGRDNNPGNNTSIITIGVK